MVTMQGTSALRLVYTIFCDDVRLEMGNKLSLMGVFQNIMVQQMPVSLIKFAVVSHWQGAGSHLSEVRILTPDKKQAVVVSQPTRFDIAPGGYADNISFFVNVAFTEPGQYWVQTLVDSTLFNEHPLTILDMRTMQPQQTTDTSEAVN